MKFIADIRKNQEIKTLMNQFPKLVKPAIAKTLNKQAADMKFQHMPKALEKDMTIRDPRFMNRQLRFTQVKPRAKVSQMFSEAGSVGIPEGGSKGMFTGWEEQQTGKPAEKSRTATQASRIGGNFKGKMRPKDRLKKANISRFLTPQDFLSSKRVHSKSQAMFFLLRESRNSQRSFIIPKGFRRIGKTRRMKAGLYGWQGKKLNRLQSFDKKYKPDRTKWMDKANKSLAKKSTSFAAVYAWQLKKSIKQSGRKL